MRDRTVSISSAGKTFSVTGWKIGWVCAPAELVRAIKTVKQFLTYTHSAPMQLAVAYALETRDGVGRASPGARCSPAATGSPPGSRPPGSRCTGRKARTSSRRTAAGSGWTTGSRLRARMPREAGVVGIPTAVFCDTPGVGTPFVRFAFCKRDDVLDEAVGRLRNWSHAGVGPAS